MKGACRVEIVFEGKGSGGDLHGEEEEEEEEEERGLLQELNSDGERSEEKTRIY